MNKLSLSFILLSLSMTCATLAQETPVAPNTTPTTELAEPTKAESKTSAKAPAKSAQRADRLDLDTTVVTGNRELPKVLYIVPWKKADLGELPAQPFNTLLDEILQPVDREVFKREVKYFQAVSSGAGSGSSSGTGASTTKSGSTPPPANPQ